MTNCYLIWLEWPEKCFRMDAKSLAFFKTLVPKGSRVIRARNERAFLKALPRATHVVTWHFKREWYPIASKLKVLATPAAGREFVSEDAPKGVRVHYGTFQGEFMAESVAAFALAWARGFFRVAEIKSRQGADAWPRTEISGDCYRVAGTRAVIAGYGHVGKLIGAKLEAVGVKVSGFGRKNVARLPAAAKTADWFILALPSGVATDGFLGAKLLAKLPRRCVVINVGRGNAIDEAALAKALESHRIAGAYLDVRRREPSATVLECEGFSERLAKLPNCIVMPHSSAFSMDYMAACFRELKREGCI